MERKPNSIVLITKLKPVGQNDKLKRGRFSLYRDDKIYSPFWSALFLKWKPEIQKVFPEVDSESWFKIYTFYGFKNKTNGNFKHDSDQFIKEVRDKLQKIVYLNDRQVVRNELHYVTDNNIFGIKIEKVNSIFSLNNFRDENVLVVKDK